MPRKTDVADSQLRPVVIEKLAKNSTSLTYRKQLANEMNVKVEYINNIYNHSKQQINELRTSMYEEGRKESEMQTGVECMKIDKKENTTNITGVEESKSHILDGFILINLEDEYIPRTKEDMENNKRLTDKQKEHICQEIEDSSECTTYSNGETKRYISYDDLKKIAARNFITIITAEKYTNEYTSVKIDKNCRVAKVSDSNNGRYISEWSREIIIDLCKTTTLTYEEIAEIAKVSKNTVYNYCKKNNIQRPYDKEDLEVKKKTNRKRKELRKIKNEIESKQRRASSENSSKQQQPTEATTSIKELVKNVEVPETAPVETKKPEPVKANRYSCSCGFLHYYTYNGKECKVCHTICKLVDEDFKPTPVEKKEEPKSVEPVKTITPVINLPVEKNEESKKPIGIIEMLNNRSIHKIVADKYIEAILVDGRHEMPDKKCIYENIGPDLFNKFDKMDQIALDFLKENIKFNEEGVADKWLKLYLTGYQAPYQAITKACTKMKVNLTCMHYNNKTNAYDEAPFNDGEMVEIYPTSSSFGIGIDAISKTFGNNLYRYKCTIRDIEQNTNCLYIIRCEENTHSTKYMSTTSIVCTSNEDCLELFFAMVKVLNQYKSYGFNVEVRKFNFNSNGEVIKNTTESTYSVM